MSDHTITFCGPKVCLPDGIVSDQNVIVKSGKILAVSNHVEGDVVELDPNCTLIPGMIDCHIHGADGADVMDAKPEALSQISQALYREGTTGFLATTMTQTPDKIERALKAVSAFQKCDENAHIIGVHLEGPFLSANKMGAQCGAFIIDPDVAVFEQYQRAADGAIKLLTLAPEAPGAAAFAKTLVNRGVVVSIGHTDATFDQAQATIDAGATHATHLFNAMRGIHHREPGAVTSVLMSDQVTAELITDGIHLNPSIVKLAYRVKGNEKLVLVTDAMRAKCMGEGQFDLGGQRVTVRGAEARLDDGVLAGSVLTMNDALKNVMHYTGIALHEAVKLTATNPANVLNCADRGSIEAGKRADFVLINDTFEVEQTFVKGQAML